MDVSICLAFPDIYDIGMSHLGTKLLYKIINKEPNFAAERVFAPWIDMAAELRKRDLPLLSLETARPLKEFDVLGFSLQYEMTLHECPEHDRPGTNARTSLRPRRFPPADYRGWTDRDPPRADCSIPRRLVDRRCGREAP